MAARGADRSRNRVLACFWLCNGGQVSITLGPKAVGVTLNIGQALTRGTRRAVSTSGLIIMALVGVYQLVFIGALNTVMRRQIPATVQPPQLGYTFPVSVQVAGALAVAGIVFGIGVYLAAARALVRPVSDLSTFPRELLTRRLGRAMVSVTVAHVAISIATILGFMLLVIPGVFLAISLVFVIFAIGVEDRRTIGALRRSWGLARGNRWRLLALGLLVTITITVANGIGSMFALVDPTAGQVLSILLTTLFTILGYGILADAFVQVRDLTETELPS